MKRNFHKYIKDSVFNNFTETVWVYLKASNSKGSNYDPYRNTGYTRANQSPEPVKAYVRQIRGNSLVARELGLVNTSAIEIVIESRDTDLFRYCEKVKYNDNYYTPFNKATGNRVQIFASDFNFSRVILFRKGA